MQHIAKLKGVNIMTFTNIRKQLAKALEDNKTKYTFYITNGYFMNWQGEEISDAGLKSESTETRWNAYKEGKISREKCIEFAVKRKMKALEKDYAKALERLEAIENAPDLDYADITVEWTRSATWGSNPKATVIVNGVRREESPSIGGCGYDKESTAIARAMNCNDTMLKLACMAVENDSEPYAISNFAEHLSLPNFGEGVGVSSYRSAFESMGYKWENVSSGKHFDVYTIRKIKK